MFSRVRLAGLLAGLIVFGATAASAGETLVAVAANFTEPARQIAQAFKAATGHTATLTFGASGQFYAQIAAGAPFEVLLSADAERPAQAEQAGLAVQGTRFTYAVGRLALYSRTAGADPATALRRGAFQKLAIADPASAPYGRAAVETLQALGLYEALKPRIVFGSSVTQAYQFVDTGAAELGFVAQSQVVEAPAGARWIVPARYHRSIDQQAILLRTGAANPAARAFLAFLKSPKAQAIIRRYGYELP